MWSQFTGNFEMQEILWAINPRFENCEFRASLLVGIKIKSLVVHVLF